MAQNEDEREETEAEMTARLLRTARTVEVFEVPPLTPRFRDLARRATLSLGNFYECPPESLFAWALNGNLMIPGVVFLHGHVDAAYRINASVSTYVSDEEHQAIYGAASAGRAFVFLSIFQGPLVLRDDIEPGCHMVGATKAGVKHALAELGLTLSDEFITNCLADGVQEAATLAALAL